VIDLQTRVHIANHARADPADLARAIGEIQMMARTVGTLRWRRFMAEAYKERTKRNRMYSLSMDGDSEHLWVQYGGNHERYCLEFANAGVFALALEVDYSDERILIDPDEPDSLFIYRKRCKWQREREARIVMLPGSPEFLRYFPRGEHPYVSFDPSILRRVILGRRMPPHTPDTIRAWAHERNPRVVVVDGNTDYPRSMSVDSGLASFMRPRLGVNRSRGAPKARIC
jgi:hypothetical protein